MKKVSIIDFDLTMTCWHTFKQNQIANMENNSPDERVEAGRWTAERMKCLKTNIHRGVAPFQFAGDDLFCVATYHNNPDFIMGYLGHMMGEKIIHTQSYIAQNGLAIRQCQLKSSDKPLLISYINASNEPEFGRTIADLHGKNEQIEFLRAILSQEGIIGAGSTCDFYDDDPNNIALAGQLFNLRTHQVATGGDLFQVMASYEARLAPPEIGAVANMSKPTLVTESDIRSWGVVPQMTSEAASMFVKQTGQVVLRNSSADGSLVITHRVGRGPAIQSMSIKNDMAIYPERYATKRITLEYFESIGIDVSMLKQSVSSLGMFGASAASAASSSEIEQDNQMNQQSLQPGG